MVEEKSIRKRVRVTYDDIADEALRILNVKCGGKERKSNTLWDILLYGGSNGDGCDNPITPWSLESRVLSERSMLGSVRGYGRPVVERSHGARSLLYKYQTRPRGLFEHLLAHELRFGRVSITD